MMNKSKVKRYLNELTDFFEDNDITALRTYYADFSAGELIDEIWNVIVDESEPNYYGY